MTEGSSKSTNKKNAHRFCGNARFLMYSRKWRWVFVYSISDQCMNELFHNHIRHSVSSTYYCNTDSNIVTRAHYCTISLQKSITPFDHKVTSFTFLEPKALNLRPGGGGVILPPPLWFFEDNSKTKRSSVTKLGIPFHWSILHLLWNFCVGVTSGQVTRSSRVT